MGCWYSRENRCHAVSCCFCVRPKKACCYIGGLGLVWGGFATALDYLIAYLPHQSCYRCLDYDLNANLSMASGCIGVVQWLASILLIHGARKGLRRLLLVWLAWSVVSLAMQLTWVAITLPYTPSFRGFLSIFQLAWGIHFFIVIKTHYTTPALSITQPEEPLHPAPPNSPSRKHKRQKRRVDPSSQPPIRTLVGVSARLLYLMNNRRGWQALSNEEEPQVIVISRQRDPEFVGQQGPEVGQQGPGVGQQGPGVGQQGPGVGQQGPGVGQQGPGVGQQGPGVGQQGPGVGGQQGPEVSQEQQGRTTRDDDEGGHRRRKKTRRRSSRKGEDLADGGGGGGSGGEGHVQRPGDASDRSGSEGRARRRRRRRREGRGTRHGEEAEGRGGDRRRRRRRRKEVLVADTRADGTTTAVDDGDMLVIVEVHEDVSRMATGDITSQGHEQRMSQTSDNANDAVSKDSSGLSSVSRADWTQQTVLTDSSYLQRTSAVEEHPSSPAGPEEMSYDSSSSPVPSSDPSKPEGGAWDSSTSTRFSSRSAGLTQGQSPTPEISRDQSPSVSGRTSQSPGPSGDLAPSQGKLSDSPSSTVRSEDLSPSPELSQDPSPSPGLSLDPSPSPGLSLDPSPSPGLPLDPSPSPGLSLDPSPSPGLPLDPSPSPGLSGEPRTSARLTENLSPLVLQEAEVMEKLDDFEESFVGVECLKVESDGGLLPHLLSDSPEKDS